MSGDLVDRDRRVCWHPYTQHGLDPEPLPVVAARGAFLELADGTRVLDAISSWWACLHGHGRPELVRALAEQATRLDHVLFAGCTHEPAVRLAERLVELAATLGPAGPRLTRVFYSDDGSTAVEVALKAAYQTWVRRGEPHRTVFVALDGAYHGDTLGAMAVGEPEPFFREFGPLLFRVARTAPESEALARVLAEHDGRVAAVILEPLLQGAAGMRVYPAAFLREARRLCDRAGVLLIADEVLTGFGRTGTRFACEQAGIAPDLLCLAKGLTGGMVPLAATLVSDEVYAAFLARVRGRAFFHGHTYTANPIGCAVALVSLDLVVREDTPGRLAAIGGAIAAALRERVRHGDCELRHLGGMVALEVASSDPGYLGPLGERLRAACRGRSVLLRPLGNVVYALPPSCVTADQCVAIADAMAVAVEDALRSDRRYDGAALPLDRPADGQE